MKRSRILLSMLILFFSCDSKQKTELAATSFDEEAEKTAILKTIDAETSSFYKRDYESWKKNFVQSNYAFQGWNTSDGSFESKVGWPEINKGAANYIRNNPVDPGSSAHPKVERRNIIVKFYSDSVAYLVWDQYNSDKEMKSYHYSKEERIMEKHNEAWKIANMSAFWDYKKSMPVDSIH